VTQFSTQFLDTLDSYVTDSSSRLHVAITRLLCDSTDFGLQFFHKKKELASSEMLSFVGQVVFDVSKDFFELSDPANDKDPSKRGQQLSQNRGVLFRKTRMFSDSAVR
jgi:hypothetical protein